MSVRHLEAPFFSALRAQATHSWGHALTAREAARAC